MSKNQNMILAIPACFVNHHSGYVPSEAPLQSLAVLDFPLFFGPRGNLEEDTTLRQIIPYVIFRQRGKFLTYVRGGGIHEVRLRGQLALGVGGHIDITDRQPYPHNPDSIDIIKTVIHCALREAEEEVGVHLTPEMIQWCGMIVDQETPVGKVHLGLVGVVDIPDHWFVGSHEPEEITKVVFMSQEEIMAMDPEKREGWTSLMSPVLHRLPA